MLGNRKSQHSFARIPDVHMARSQFDRSFAAKDTFDFDYLVPFFVDEIIPGDTSNLSVATFARLATQIRPVMDNLYIDYFFFFVPNRLVWDNWEKFNGAQDNPGDSTSFIIPTLTTTAVTGEVVGSIYDKFGIPTQVPGLVINSLPFRAYMLCYNEWFRDQNLINSVTVPTDDGPDVPSDFYMLKRAKKHDYFTSCLPWPQKGTAVSMPLGISAPVVRNSAVPAWTSYVTGTNTLNTAGALSANGSGQIAGAGGLISLDPGTNGLSADLSAPPGRYNQSTPPSHASAVNP